MGLRFRKSFKIAPGVRVNVSTRGTSLSVGKRGLTTNISRRGVRSTIGIPGSGISYTTRTARWNNRRNIANLPNRQFVNDASFVPLKEVRVGQEVCIAELNQLATVLALPDKNGDVLVRAGIIKTKIPLKGLKQPDKLIKEPQPKTKAQQRYSRLTGDANRPNGRVERVQRSAKMELNLLGLTVDEALPEVDAYIDRAILNGQTVVYLIHGNGTGALRTAIHKHLRGNRMVKSFRLGRYGEGESGVTVVELK